MIFNPFLSFEKSFFIDIISRRQILYDKFYDSMLD